MLIAWRGIGAQLTPPAGLMYARLRGIGSAPTGGGTYLNTGQFVQQDPFTVGDYRSVAAYFGATDIVTGAALSLNIVSAKFSLYNAATGAVVTGYNGVAATVLTPDPATTVYVSAQVNCDPGKSNPVGVGSYVMEATATDVNSNELVVKGSLIVTSAVPSVL